MEYTHSKVIIVILIKYKVKSTSLAEKEEQDKCIFSQRQPRASIFNI